MTENAQAFIDRHVAAAQPLLRETALANWDACVSGKEADFERWARLQSQVMKLYANADEYNEVKQLAELGSPDPLVARQLHLLKLSYAAAQNDPETIDRMTELEKQVQTLFNNYRGKVDGHELSDNEIDDILRSETDSARLQAVWEASKQVGAQVASLVLDLVRLRNQSARKQGYPNYYNMMLILNEIDEDRLFQILDELATLTHEPFQQEKARLDAQLAAIYQISVSELRPRHYHNRFFQEPPLIGEAVNLDRMFADKSLEDLAIQTFTGMGMEVGDILERSDLYERPGKYQHAFCVHIDRNGDVRTMDSLKPTYYWMSTLLHELGHGVYDKYLVPAGLPFLLRTPAHTLSTEAIAFLMQRQALNPHWLQQIVGANAAEVARLEPVLRTQTRLDKLIFVRWMLVMTHFEQAMYRDPEQDLNTLWWDLVEKYQMLTRPAGRNAPDWAAKIHLALYPVYYQNYMLGELATSQLAHALQNACGALLNNRQAGQWLVDRYFSLGARYDWDETVEKATGERLNPKYFVEEFTQVN